MIYKELNGTDLKVSALCLGTAAFGALHNEGAHTEEYSRRQLELFLEAGGNFIDTAHVYNDWIPGERSRSEKITGRWLRDTGCRDRVILVTKGAHPPLDRMEESRVSRACIRRDIAESLEYLQTDAVDLYLLHRDDPAVPAGEIVEWMNELAGENKLRYWGVSNWRMSRIREANDYARIHKLRPAVCSQTMWSYATICREHLADQTLAPLEQADFAYHKETGLNLMAFTSQAKGYFARLAAGEHLPPDITSVYGNAENAGKLHRLERASKESGISIAGLCLLYFLDQPFPAVPIVSYDTPALWQEALAAYQPETVQAFRQVSQLL